MISIIFFPEYNYLIILFSNLSGKYFIDKQSLNIFSLYRLAKKAFLDEEKVIMNIP